MENRRAEYEIVNALLNLFSLELKKKSRKGTVIFYFSCN